MEPMTARWTDDRLDDLKHQVEAIGRRMDEGFGELRDELREYRREMDARFDKVDARFDKVDARFERIDGRLDRTQEMIAALNRTVTRFSLGLAGVLAAWAAAHLT
jgi:predicted nuclease with TOPRIM domain